MDGRPVLGGRTPPTTGSNGNKRTTGNIVKNTPRIHPNGKGRDRAGHRGGPIGTGSTSHKLAKICGRQKRPAYKDGPRIQNKRE